MRVVRHALGRRRGSATQPPAQTGLIRRWISPLMLLAALSVGHLLLTQLVPKLRANLLEVPETFSVHWSAPIWSAGEIVSRSQPAVLGTMALMVAVSLLLTVMSRPTAMLVHMAGVCLCVLDLLILIGALTFFSGQLLDNVP